MIGSGAFGSVARAEFGKPKKVCTIKLMRRTGNEASNRLVRREIATLSKVDHSNCCILAQIVVLIDYYALVMESEVLLDEADEFVLPDYAALWCGQLTSVVHTLHHRYQLVHRDIKPNNVFFDAHYRVKLGDFGFAKANTTDLRHTKCGSDLFTPPEMHRPKRSDGGLDYSPIKRGLGFIIHLVYTNRLPYTMDQLEKAQVVSLPPILRQLELFQDLIPRGRGMDCTVGRTRAQPKKVRNHIHLARSVVSGETGGLEGWPPLLLVMQQR